MNKIKTILVSNLSFFKELLIFSILLTLINTSIISIGIVPSSSMYPTIPVPSIIIGQRTYKQIERFDIVQFYSFDSEHTPFVKRCIGLPGDTVEIKNNEFYINDILIQPYNFEGYEDGSIKYYVPKRKDLVNVIYSSNNCNCYINNHFVGNIDFLNKYCSKEEGQYLVKENCYFMIGDNVNNSYDSRYWKYMYVTETNIVSKIKVIINLNIKQKEYTKYD